MNNLDREQFLDALRNLILFLKKERALREFSFFINAYEILNAEDISSESFQESKELLLRGMEFAAPGSFSDLGFWRDNVEERLQINRELDQLSNRLLELVKKN